ncbi:MAG: LuxR C-terminal-related transcriptional regulator [Anaerolineae bacterium]
MSPSNSNMIETFTERELAILAELVEGLSNQEIANKLHLSLKTVKWYNTQIFSKLGVSDRKQATELARRLHLIDAPDSVPQPPNNLPEETTPFVGREADVQELSQLLLEPARRCMSIVGLGGIGKTRLALQTGQMLLRYFPDGVYLVRLAPVRRAVELIEAIARVLQINQSGTPDKMLEGISGHLRTKNLLLILDNFEHLLPEAAEFVTDLLRQTTGLKLLITSRERLSLMSETVYTPKGLPFPAVGVVHEVINFDAVKLFMQSAGNLTPTYQPQPEDWPHIVQICHLTEGIPLAIVLAAAWTSALSVAEIAEEIRNSLDFLSVEMRDIPERQWSMQAVFESTWKRLTEAERRAFMKLAVFRGGFTRQAARDVAGFTPQLLLSLINKSLIWRSDSGERFEIHELLRQYARAKLADSGLRPDVELAHTAYFINFLAQSVENLKRGDPAIVEAITSDWDNIVASIRPQLAAHTGNIDTIRNAADALYFFIDVSQRTAGPIYTNLQLLLPSPVRQVFEVRLMPLEEPAAAPNTHLMLDLMQQLESQSAHRDLALGKFRYGVFLMDWVNDRTAAIVQLHQSLDIFEQLGALYECGLTLMALGWATWLDYEQQSHFMRRALDIFERLGNRVKMAHVCIELAHCYGFSKGDPEEGDYYGNLGFQLATETGVTRLVLLSRIYLGWSAFGRSDLIALRAHAYACIEGNSGIFDDNMVAVHPYYFLAVATCLDEQDYSEALRIIDYARTLITHPSGALYFIPLAMAYLGLGRFQESITSVKPWLEAGAGARKIPPIVLIALAYVHIGRTERAAELWGGCQNYPSAIVWAEKWALAIDTIAEMKAKLGNADYDAALARGKSSNLDTIATQLLSEI